MPSTSVNLNLSFALLNIVIKHLVECDEGENNGIFIKGIHKTTGRNESTLKSSLWVLKFEIRF